MIRIGVQNMFEQYGKVRMLAASVCAMSRTESYMKMHMKHEHGDAHLCVCWLGGDVGREKA